MWCNHDLDLNKIDYVDAMIVDIMITWSPVSRRWVHVDGWQVVVVVAE